MHVERWPVGAGERRLAALKEERIEIGREVVGIIHQNDREDSQNQHDREPSQNRL